MVLFAILGMLVSVLVIKRKSIESTGLGQSMMMY